MASAGTCGFTCNVVRCGSPTGSRHIDGLCCQQYSKSRMREEREIDRARRALQQCETEKHTVDEEGDDTAD